MNTQNETHQSTLKKGDIVVHVNNRNLYMTLNRDLGPDFTVDRNTLIYECVWRIDGEPYRAFYNEKELQKA